MKRAGIFGARHAFGARHTRGAVADSGSASRLPWLTTPLGSRVAQGLRTLPQLLWSVRFGGAILLYALAARGWFFFKLVHEPVTPFNFDAACCSNGALACWAVDDVAFAFDCGLIALGAALAGVIIEWLVEWLGRPIRRALGVTVDVVACFLLAVIGLTHTAYYKVAFLMQAQLDYTLLNEALQSGFGWGDVIEYVSLVDLALIAGPAIVYLLLCAKSTRAVTLQSLALCTLGGVLMLRDDPYLRHPPRPELLVNPPASVITSLATDWGKRPLLGELEIKPTPQDLQAMGLRPLQVPPPLTRAPANADPVSVVIMVMESVGRRYALDHVPEAVMPNLQALSASSLFLANHLSPSNSSTNSLFSVFTGLYPAPIRAVFASQQNLRIKPFHQYLPWIKDAFLITPGGLKSYFPRGLLSNGGMELRDRSDLALPNPRPPPVWWAADERDGVDAFLARLARSESPVFAVYYSYAAHSPYFDYGPEFRLMPDKSLDINRYYNNLRLLDTQLARIVDAVHARPERTLLLVLGDHGEAFNQHPGNIKHSRRSFQENFETFALLHLPGTFQPRKVTERTVHIDLLPTVLTALGVPFPESQFQGINLMTADLARPYIFLYGNEGTLSSINRDGVKLQLSYWDGSCKAFDLLKDPAERTERPCNATRQFAEPDLLDQMQHIGMFHAYQPTALRQLQAASARMAE